MATRTNRKQLPNHRIPVGTASCIQALMIAITWTTAKVVHATIRKNMIITVERVAVLHGEYTVLATEQVELTAGTLVCFTRSTHRTGYYYLTVYNPMSGGWHCSCPRKATGCHHVEDAITFMIAREDGHQKRKREQERERVLAERRRESEAELARIMAETEASIAAELATPVQPKSEQARIADFPHSATATVVSGGQCNSIAAAAQRQMNALANRAKRPAKTTPYQPDETTARLMAAGLMR